MGGEENAEAGEVRFRYGPAVRSGPEAVLPEGGAVLIQMEGGQPRRDRNWRSLFLGLV